MGNFLIITQSQIFIFQIITKLLTLVISLLVVITYNQLHGNSVTN